MSGRSRGAGKVVAVVASPLEAAVAGRLAAARPEEVELVYRPDLLPPPRFPADHGGDPGWRRTAAQEQAWRALLGRAEVTWDLATVGDDGPLALSPGLRWVQTTSAGVGARVAALGLDRSAVLVTTASGVHARPLAEFVLAALLYHTKRFAHLQAEQRAHRWERFAAGELHGRTMAIVGLGRIGREVVRVARAFGMAVWATSRSVAGGDARDRAAARGVDRLFPPTELRALLAGADCVVLAVPQTPETEGLIGAAELAAMRRGVVFVNIARGAVVDEAALVAALRSGRVGFAALDVVREEPLALDSPLWDLPNVLISPHSASTVADENEKIAELFLANLECYLAGEYGRMAPLLDKGRGY